MTSLPSQGPRLGVIEGFYGKPWGAGARRDMIDWLAQLGIHAYLYAPKADPWLRRNWRSAWPGEERAALTGLAQRADAVGLLFGVGLSPFGIYQSYGPAQKRALRDRIFAINDLGASLLAILFDDMPGDQPDLATTQAQVMADVAGWSSAKELLLCPTYYSEDPVLDRFFGARPEGYLSDLAAELPSQVALFWTGSAVCSERIGADDLPSAAVIGAQPLALWDNYPVNDSKSRSDHLYLAPFDGRDQKLAATLAWHWSNAMNQAALSLPAIASLAALYGQPPQAAQAVFAAAGISEELIGACGVLATQRLQELSVPQRLRLQHCSGAAGRAAQELEAFLAGEYRFDPACLTD